MIDKDLPELDQNTYVKETALALWEGLPKIILCGFLFSLISLPAVLLGLLGFVFPAILLSIFTTGPAWTAMCATITRVVLRDPFSIIDFFRAFGHFYLRSLVLASMMALPFFSAAWCLPYLASPPVPSTIWVILGAGVTSVFFLAALYLYAYPLLALYDITVRTALRNSFLLAIRYLGNTLGLLALAGLLVWLAVRVHLLLLVILPAGWLVFAINNCRMVIRLELGNPQVHEKK